MTDSYDINILPTAYRQLREASVWWKTNRPSVPDLFDFEFSHVLYRLTMEPEISAPVRKGRKQLRRMYMRKSHYHVYYLVHPRKRQVEIRSVWSARRGTTPSV